MSNKRQTLLFASPEGLDLELDYYPAPTDSSTPAPVIFTVHGGGGIAGDKADLRLWTLALARNKGWAVVSADYRTIPESSAATGVEDVIGAYKFITDGSLNKAIGSEAVDPKRIVVVGISAGAWSATLLCATADVRPKAFIDVYGVFALNAGGWDKPAVKQIEVPHGLQEKFNDTFEEMCRVAKEGKAKLTKGAYLNLFQMAGQPDSAFLALAAANGISAEELKEWGLDRPMTDEELARNIMCPWAVNKGCLDGMASGPAHLTPPFDRFPKDPSSLIDANFPPTLLIHGTGDSFVPFHVSEKLQAVLEKQGVKHEMMPFEGGEHMLDLAWHPHTEEYGKIVAFLDSVGI